MALPQQEQPASPGAHLYTIKSAASSGIELQFFLRPAPDSIILLRTHQPRHPQKPVHQASLSLTAFEELTHTLLKAPGARPTLDLTDGTVKLHLTTRSRRPGRLSVRSEAGAEVLNYSPLNPVSEEFQRILALAQKLRNAQPPQES